MSVGSVSSTVTCRIAPLPSARSQRQRAAPSSKRSLTVVRKKDAKGFHDVNLDCLGTITGWQPLGNDGDVELTWIDMSRAGSPVKNATGTCDYGRHEAASDGPFALYVWAPITPRVTATRPAPEAGRRHPSVSRSSDR
jgi:IgGFc binding protein